MNDDIKDEYDFSRADRSKFYRKDAVPAPPVHFDPDLLAFLTERRRTRHVVE